MPRVRPIWIFFILFEINLIFDLMILLQSGIQLMESFLINILQIRVLYSFYRQLLFPKEGIDYCLNRRINYRKNGHADDHTKDFEQDKKDQEEKNVGEK